MSSYLLAFVIGEYDFIEEQDSNGVLVKVYTPVGKSNLGQFALDVSCEDDGMYTCMWFEGLLLCIHVGQETCL